MEFLGGSIHKPMQTSLGKYPQVVNGLKNWEQIDKYRKQKKYKKAKKSQNKKKPNPNELWDYNIPQSIGDVWSDFKLRIKKEKWDEVFIEKESESNLWTQMVSNISPAQPMKMDTFERPLAGEWNRSDMMVEGGVREVEGSRGFGLN